MFFKKTAIFILIISLSIIWTRADVILPEGKGTLKTEKIDGYEVFNVLDLAKIYGGNFGKDPISKYPYWEINKHRVVFSVNSAVVSVDSKIVSLQSVPFEKNSGLYVGIEFLRLVLPKIGIPFVEEPLKEHKTQDSKNIEEPKEQKEIKIETAVSYDLIRVTFEGTMVSFAEPKKVDDKVVVRFPKGRAQGANVDFGEGIATKMVSTDEGKEIQIFLDKNFKQFESVTLKNPERLVLIIKGTGQKTSDKNKTSDTTQPQESYFAQETPFQKKKDSILVVLDPGHGAQDTGTIAKDGTQEKELSLLYASKLKEALEKEGINVLLTRNSDVFIPLRERTALANFNSADIFISIHFNSSPVKSVKGSESYIMSKQATDLWSKEVAEKENLSLSSEEKGEDLSLILWNLAQNQFIVESASVAGELQEKLNQLFGTKDRGVRQAPFAVLEGARMPAILLEIAFLSNPEELKQVKDDKFIENVISSIKEVLVKFKERNVPPPSN
ncbi:MAG: N-acetylmuramoyl-L-alanine amidase [Thermoanaerobaculaceae bacterium]|nr:N-acetylmuramoyl-L-alanine amidase [Thermoanaerobaculaceae bacterium]